MTTTLAAAGAASHGHADLPVVLVEPGQPVEAQGRARISAT